MSKSASTSVFHPSSTSTTTPSVHRTDSRTIAAGIALGVVGILLIVGIVLFTLRVRNQQRRRAAAPEQQQEQMPSARRSTAGLFRGRDPEFRVTPFNNSPVPDGPRFFHVPGANMRIATRRPDGAWNFEDSRTPFTPTGISEIEPARSPGPYSPSWPLASSSSSIISQSMTAKEKEREAIRGLRGAGYGGKAYGADELEMDLYPGPDVIAPPAYVYGHDDARGRNSASSFGTVSARAASPRVVEEGDVRR